MVASAALFQPDLRWFLCFFVRFLMVFGCFLLFSLAFYPLSTPEPRFQTIHQSVEANSKQFLQATGRYVYVLPA